MTLTLESGSEVVIVEGDLGGGAVVEVGQSEVLEGEVGVGLGGDGTHARRGRRDRRSDRQELGGHSDAPRLTVVGPGHDRERHVPKHSGREGRANAA